MGRGLGRNTTILDAKQRYMENNEPITSSERMIIGGALRSIRARADLDRIKSDDKEARKVIESEFLRLDLPKSWRKRRVLWLKEVTLNTLLHK